MSEQCRMVTVLPGEEPDENGRVDGIPCAREATEYIETGDSRPLPMCREHALELREALAWRDKREKRRRKR